MRLWHQNLISKLPQKQLCGQWRECIALLGNGWGKKHSTVNYVFEHEESMLVHFTYKVYNEMKKRNYKPDKYLISLALLKRHTLEETEVIMKEAYIRGALLNNTIIYPEHNKKYYKECIENLKAKGIEIK